MNHVSYQLHSCWTVIVLARFQLSRASTRSQVGRLILIGRVLRTASLTAFKMLWRICGGWRRIGASLHQLNCLQEFFGAGPVRLVLLSRRCILLKRVDRNFASLDGLFADLGIRAHSWRSFYKDPWWRWLQVDYFRRLDLKNCSLSARYRVCLTRRMIIVLEHHFSVHVMISWRVSLLHLLHKLLLTLATGCSFWLGVVWIGIHVTAVGHQHRRLVLSRAIHFRRRIRVFLSFRWLG